MDEVDLRGPDTLKDLLDAHPEHNRGTIAIRAALRVLPVVFQEIDEQLSESYGPEFALCCLRTAITALARHVNADKADRASNSAVSESQLSLMSASSEAVFAESHCAAQALSNALACTNATGTTALQLALDACEYSTSAFVIKQSRSNTISDNSERKNPNIPECQRREAEEGFRKSIFSDFELLEKLSVRSLNHKVLWPATVKHGMMFSGWPDFALTNDPSWRFWQNWYMGIMEGTPLNAPLQLRISQIADSIWDKGPEAVANAIQEIEADLAGPAPLKEKTLRNHAEYLLKNPTLTEATALNGAETIERAIADYLREAPANCLPEDLKHLEALPQHFKAIARVIGSQAAKDEKENRLVDEISKLHARVAELEKELAVAKGKELKGVISLEAAKAFGKTIGSPYFYGGIAMGVSYFFGVSPSDMTFENLRGYVGELWRAHSEGTVSSPPYLPPSTYV